MGSTGSPTGAVTVVRQAHQSNTVTELAEVRSLWFDRLTNQFGH